MARYPRLSSPVLLIFCCLFLIEAQEIQSDSPPRDLEPFVKRPSSCYEKIYDLEQLPTATIVITVVNELPHLLEANLKSIFARTPDQLIDSIIVVDDSSEVAFPQEVVNKFPKTTLIRTSKPSGVAGARMAGAEHGEGAVLVFLDSHMEMTNTWLEPLLQYVADHPRSIAESIIDVLDPEGSTVPLSSETRVALVTLDETALDFKYTTQLDADLITGEPLYSPVILGSAFAITREWWNQGQYDPTLEVWGIENIEIAVRSWTCGGTVVFHPCSHVGHHFGCARLPTTKPRWQNQDFIARNQYRFAKVWMDDYQQELFSSLKWDPERVMHYEQTLAPSLKAREQLRTNLKCKPWRWYMNNVVSEIEDIYGVHNYEKSARSSLGKDNTKDDTREVAGACAFCHVTWTGTNLEQGICAPLILKAKYPYPIESYADLPGGTVSFQGTIKNTIAGYRYLVQIVSLVYPISGEINGATLAVGDWVLIYNTYEGVSSEDTQVDLLYNACAIPTSLAVGQNYLLSVGFRADLLLNGNPTYATGIRPMPGSARAIQMAADRCHPIMAWDSVPSSVVTALADSPGACNPYTTTATTQGTTSSTTTQATTSSSTTQATTSSSTTQATTSSSTTQATTSSSTTQATTSSTISTTTEGFPGKRSEVSVMNTQLSAEEKIAAFDSLQRQVQELTTQITKYKKKAMELSLRSPKWHES